MQTENFWISLRILHLILNIFRKNSLDKLKLFKNISEFSTYVENISDVIIVPFCLLW